MLADYERVLDEIADKLTSANHGIAVELATLPESIRGFGPVKKASAETADTRRDELLTALSAREAEDIRAA